MEDHSWNNLNEDVLIGIFQYLSYEDLVRCESVCCQWRNVMLNGTPWKNWLHDAIILLPLWQQVWKKTSINEDKLRSAECRGICQTMQLYLKELDSNWRNGRYTKLKVPFVIDGQIVQLSDDFIIYKKNHLLFLNKNTMQITEHVKLGTFDDVIGITKDMIICQEFHKVQIIDRQTGLLTAEINSDWSIDQCLFHDDLLVISYSSERRESTRLRVWRVPSPSRFILLKQWTFEESYFNELSYDQKFIAFSSTVESGNPKTRSIHFVSMKTLEIDHTLIVEADRLTYCQGLLFIQNALLIQVYNVASRRYLNSLPANSRRPFDMLNMNSKYVIIMQEKNISVYDLEAIKNPSAEPQSVLLTSLKLNFVPHEWSIDETKISLAYKALRGYRNVTKFQIIDFSPPVNLLPSCAKLEPIL